MQNLNIKSFRIKRIFYSSRCMKFRKYSNSNNKGKTLLKTKSNTFKVNYEAMSALYKLKSTKI